MICSVAVDKISAELERRVASYYRTELLVCFCCFGLISLVLSRKIGWKDVFAVTYFMSSEM